MGMRHLRRLVKHGGWITFSIAILFVVTRAVPEPVLRGAIEVGGNFLQTFGGIYGIIVAFAIYVTWGEHNDTQVAIEREAVSLLELYRVLGWFPTWVERGAVRQQLHRYALTVPKAHLPHAAGNDRQEHEMLDKSLASFLSHSPGSPTEERLFPHALSLFHELNEAREHRVTVANLKLPNGLRWFVFIGGAICVGALDLLWVDSFAIHAALVAGMTWVIVAAASITVDLDDPYAGDFVVDWQRFHKTADLMEQTECNGAGP
ncbi:MAG: hypothetical protein H6Q89_4080 [Myxococcaceae bacterium]|nr:hypothetical protein [Myxococcaceae bacterium]